MGNIIKMIFGLFMGTGGGLGLPMILGIAAAALTALSAAAYSVYRWDSGRIADAETRGRQECIGRVNDQAMKDMQQQLDIKTREAQEAVTRARELEDMRERAESERRETSDAASQAHETINSVKTACTVPDAMVDAVNSLVPPKVEKKQAAAPQIVKVKQR